MSAQATAFVWQHARYRDKTFVVLLAIADTVNDMNDNRFWMSLVKLADKARVDRVTARRAVATLVADGFLTCIEAATLRAPATYEMRFTSGEPLTRGGESSAPGGGEPLTPNSREGTQVEPKREVLSLKRVPRTATGRTRRRPEGELLTPDRLAFALECGLSRKEATTEWAIMGDHEFQSPRSDWSATWRTWVRRWKPATPALPYRPSFARSSETAPARPAVPGPEATRAMLQGLFRQMP